MEVVVVVEVIPGMHLIVETLEDHDLLITNERDLPVIILEEKYLPVIIPEEKDLPVIMNEEEVLIMKEDLDLHLLIVINPLNNISQKMLLSVFRNYNNVFVCCLLR